MQVLGHEVGVAHRHGDRLMPEDGLEGGDVASLPRELRGKMVPQVMAAERHLGVLGNLSECTGEGGVTLSVAAPDPT